MLIFRPVALMVCFALLASACVSDGPGVATDSAPFETGTTFPPPPTTANPVPDRSEQVPHRLLIDGSDIGTPYRTAVLTNEDVWELDGNVELSDGGESVNLSFSLPALGACDVRSFSDLRFDPDTGVLAPLVVLKNTDICVPLDVHTIVVSVQRRHLPREFTLSVAPSVSPAGLSGQTKIGVGQLGIPDGDPLALRDDNDLALGDVRYVALSTHCGVEQIGYLINGSYWQLTGGPGGGDYVPSEWRRFVDGETIMLEMKLSGPDVLFVSPSGQGLELAYGPISEAELAGCI